MDEDVWKIAGRSIVITSGMQRLGGTLADLDPHVRDEALGDVYVERLMELCAGAPDRVLYVIADHIWQQHLEGYRTTRPRLHEIERMIRRALAMSAQLELLRRRLPRPPRPDFKLPHRHGRR